MIKLVCVKHTNIKHLCFLKGRWNQRKEVVGLIRFEVVSLTVFSILDRAYNCHRDS